MQCGGSSNAYRMVDTGWKMSSLVGLPLLPHAARWSLVNLAGIPRDEAYHRLAGRMPFSEDAAAQRNSQRATDQGKGNRVRLVHG
jgi:hypothetical protein